MTATEQAMPPAAATIVAAALTFARRGRRRFTAGGLAAVAATVAAAIAAAKQPAMTAKAGFDLRFERELDHSRNRQAQHQSNQISFHQKLLQINDRNKLPSRRMLAVPAPLPATFASKNNMETDDGGFRKTQKPF
jgi:hypothetical protein